MKFRIIAVLRILLGAGFILLGVLKLMDTTFLYGGLLHELDRHGAPFYFYRRFVLGRFVELHQELFAHAVAIGEILLGASFLTGTLVSAASVGGAFLMLNFGLATSAGDWPRLAAHILFALLFLWMGRRGAGLTWGVDGWLVERVHEGIVLFPLRLSLPEK